MDEQARLIGTLTTLADLIKDGPHRIEYRTENDTRVLEIFDSAGTRRWALGAPITREPDVIATSPELRIARAMVRDLVVKAAERVQELHDLAAHRFEMAPGRPQYL